MQSNPDEGLRYALPLGGDAGRGLARPGDRLGTRNTNFNLSNFNQSRPADPWHLSYEMQEKLRANYRRLATRELQLGRHRRAAYIFAQLLGDYSSAANALKQGHHFREAAVLYRERLGQKLAAADCLCEGGLVIEAIPIYEELGLFERAGDLYQQLAQPEQAAACYRKAVNQLAAHDDHLKAAALLETKLAAPREALAMLDSTWPGKPHAPACLDEAFRLLARLKDFSEAQARVKRLRNSAPPPHLIPRMAQVLAEVAATFPEDATRHLAADATKVVIGKRLPNASESETRTLTQFLPKLAAADRLLPRDAQRYVQKLQPPPFKPTARSVQLAPPPQRKALLSAQVIRTLRLPSGTQWTTFTSAGPVFYAIGTVSGLGNGHTLILQSTWDSVTRTRDVGEAVARPQALVYCENPAQLWAVDPPFGARHVINGFAQAKETPRVEIGMPWLPSNPLAIACDEQHNAWVLHNEVSGSLGIVLSVYDPSTGRLIATHTVDSDIPPDVQLKLPVPLAVRSNHAYLALGTRILTLAYGRTWQATMLPHPVTHMAASHPLARMRVAVGMEMGGVVFTDGLESHPLAEAMDFPILAFSRGGALLAVARSEIRLYRMSGRRPEYRGTWPGYGFDASSPGAAVLPTDRMDEIALIAPDGQVRIIGLGA